MTHDDQIKNDLRFTNRLLKFDDRYWKRGIEFQVNPKTATELAFVLIQSESHALLRGIKSSVKEKNLRAAGSLLRSLLESAANAHWIAEDKSNKRARKYIDVMNKYSECLANITESGVDRIPKDGREWTSSSVEDRINAFSPQAGMVWDYCSAFTHPSPTFLSLEHESDKVLSYVLEQANIYVLTIRYLMVENCNLFDKRETKYLEGLVDRII